jgi:hypothetical protein
MRARAWLAGVAAAAAACGSRDAAPPRGRDAAPARPESRAEAPGDAGPADARPAGAAAWDALAALPAARPRWRVDVPRDPLRAERGLVGPLVVDGVALVAGEAIGVAGVDVATGDLVLHRPEPPGDAGPVVYGSDAMLVVAPCLHELPVAPGDRQLGCYAALAVRGQAAYGAGSVVIAAEALPDGVATGRRELRVAGRRAFLGAGDGGDAAWVTFELPEPPRGEVRATPVAPRDVPPAAHAPRVRSAVGGHPVDAWLDDDALDLRYHDPDVLAPRAAVARVAVAPGGVWEAPGGGAVRAFSFPEPGADGAASVQPVEIPLDQLVKDPLAPPLPGIAVLAAAHDPATGAFVAAIRLDATLTHDYVAAFTPAAALAWVWRLPPPRGGARALPTGVGITAAGVVVFHDGSAVTGLPPP